MMAEDFPVNYHWKRIQTQTLCKKGCYLLDMGGSGGWKCERKDRKGHVQKGHVKFNEDEGLFWDEEQRR